MAVLLITALVVGVAVIAYPGVVDAGADARRTPSDSVAYALQQEQQQMAAALERYTADTSGYTIPIDSAIARLAQPQTPVLPAGLADTGN